MSPSDGLLIVSRVSFRPPRTSEMLLKWFYVVLSVSVITTICVLTLLCPAHVRTIIVRTREISLDMVNISLAVHLPRNALAAVPEETARPLRIVYWSNRDIWNFGTVRHTRTCHGKYQCEHILDRSQYFRGDVILVDVHRLRFFGGLPRFRFPHQKWGFFMIESPLRMFTKLKPYEAQLFNFSITYKSTSDLPHPYGKCRRLQPGDPRPPIRNRAFNKTDIAAWFISNCADKDSGRIRYSQELQRYVPVHIYGRCGTYSCTKTEGNYCYEEVRSFAQLIFFFKKSKINLDRAHPTHPTPIQTFF